jgi:hypothetical protein
LLIVTKPKLPFRALEKSCPQGMVPVCKGP